MKHIKYIILILIVGVGFLSADVNEDEMLMKAIYYSQKSPKNASVYWKRLFELTNNEKYLIQYFYSLLEYKDIKDVIKELKEVLKKKKSKELYELLGSLYSQEGDTDGVIEVIENLANGDTESMYELAYIYNLKGKRDKALKIYKKLYNKNHDWKSLKGILSILVKQKKKQEAAKILWEALHKYKMPKDAYLVMAGLLNEKDVDKAIFVFKKLYSFTKDKEVLKQLISLYLYKKDYNSIINLLKSTHFDDKLLYELYISQDKKVEAYKLLDSLYKKYKKPKWLAEKAILTFEIAQKYKSVDSKVLQVMSNLFEKAFKAGAKDAMYCNYYGYTLIEKNMDIKKGLEYVKKALKLKPNNLYYIDSLMWGYYKLKDCKKAKEIVNRVKKEFKNIKEKEILKHIEAIDKCKEL